MDAAARQFQGFGGPDREMRSILSEGKVARAGKLWVEQRS